MGMGMGDGDGDGGWGSVARWLVVAGGLGVREMRQPCPVLRIRDAMGYVGDVVECCTMGCVPEA